MKKHVFVKTLYVFWPLWGPFLGPSEVILATLDLKDSFMSGDMFDLIADCLSFLEGQLRDLVEEVLVLQKKCKKAKN